MTPFRRLDTYPITTRMLEVRRVQDITPGMRRVTLGGPQLQAFTAGTGYPVAAFRSDGFDDEFKLLIRHPDVKEAVGPTQAAGLLNWPRDPHMLVRTYTVRRYDAEQGEIDVDLVRHAGGAASEWAETAQVGEKMQIAGPKMSAGQPVGADWLLIGGDETALPAIGRWLENWPVGARAQVFIEVRRDSHRQEVLVPQGVQLTWLSREGRDLSENLLLDAVQRMEWWEGEVFVWLAGEANSLKPVRQWLQERGLSRDQLDITGHWTRRERQPQLDAGATAESRAEMPGAESSATAMETGGDTHDRFHALTDLVTPMVVRVAVTLGLAECLTTGPKTGPQLVAETGADPEGLPLLLRALVDTGLLSVTGDRYALTPLGEELTDEHHIQELSLDGVEGQRDLALLNLLEAVRSTKPAGSHRASDAHLEEEAEQAQYYGPPLTHHPVLTSAQHLWVQGRSAPAYAALLARNLPHLQVTALVPTPELPFWQGQLDPSLRQRVHLQDGHLLDIFLPAQRPDVVLLTEALTPLASGEAVKLLRRAAQVAGTEGRVLLWAEPRQDVLADMDTHSEALRQFAATGGYRRSDPELRDLFTQADLYATQADLLGWGMTLYQVRGSA